MAQSLGWLDAMVGTVRCAACGTTYVRSDLRVAGERGGYLLVRCDCRTCGKEGVLVVMVEVATARVPLGGRPARPPIGEDDVLTAHEILRGYTGNAEGLFRRDEVR